MKLKYDEHERSKPMNDLSWMNTDTCKRMMEMPWFDFLEKGYEYRLSRTPVFDSNQNIEKAILYRRVDGVAGLYVPLPLHAAWVLQRAEEEMGDRVRIHHSSKKKWELFLMDEGCFMWDKYHRHETSFPSRSATVLAAYDHLYPAEVKEEFPNSPADDTAEKQGHTEEQEQQALRDMGPGQRHAAAMEERVGRLEAVQEKNDDRFERLFRRQSRHFNKKHG